MDADSIEWKEFAILNYFLGCYFMPDYDDIKTWDEWVEWVNAYLDSQDKEVSDDEKSMFVSKHCRRIFNNHTNDMAKAGTMTYEMFIVPFENKTVELEDKAHPGLVTYVQKKLVKGKIIDAINARV